MGLSEHLAIFPAAEQPFSPLPSAKHDCRFLLMLICFWNVGSHRKGGRNQVKTDEGS